MLYKKNILESFAKFTGAHQCQSLSYLMKLQAEAEACNFFKKETLAQVFSDEFLQTLQTPQGDCFWKYSEGYPVNQGFFQKIYVYAETYLEPSHKNLHRSCSSRF